MSLKLKMKWVGCLASALFLVGCQGGENPRFVYMPDMAYSPALKYQEQGMKPPVPGTFPRGYYPLPENMEMEDAGKSLKNPLKRTAGVLKRGEFMFKTFCAVCHGDYGEGDGSIVPKFPRPPSLQSDKIRNYPDGNIYYIISHGQNLMPSYAAQIDQPDRWAIIHYIRAIQRAKHPTPEDVKAFEASGEDDSI